MRAHPCAPTQCSHNSRPGPPPTRSQPDPNLSEPFRPAGSEPARSDYSRPDFDPIRPRTYLIRSDPRRSDPNRSDPNRSDPTPLSLSLCLLSADSHLWCLYHCACLRLILICGGSCWWGAGRVEMRLGVGGCHRIRWQWRGGEHLLRRRCL